MIKELKSDETYSYKIILPDDRKVIPTEANEVSEVEESIGLIKISRLRPSADGLRSK